MLQVTKVKTNDREINRTLLMTGLLLQPPDWDYAAGKPMLKTSFPGLPPYLHLPGG